MDTVDYAEVDHLPRRLSTIPDESESPTLLTRFIKTLPTPVLLPRDPTGDSLINGDSKPDVGFNLTDIDLNLAQYSLAFTDFWADRDVRDDIEAGHYTMKLLADRQLDKLKMELFYLCRRDFAKRLRILCDLLMHELNIELHDPRLRGDVSQTCLHAALIHDSPEAARVLIEMGGKALILTAYSKKEYLGVTFLHIAVVKGNCDLIKMIMEHLTWKERIWLIKAQAKRTYFMQRFSASGLALTLAVWSNQMEIFDLLLQYGAQIDAKDAVTGNTVIHSLVEYAVMDSSKACDLFTGLLFRESCKVWWCKRNDIHVDDLTEDSITMMRNYLLRQTNGQGYTPLHLAARLGSCCIFQEIINVEGVYRFTQWKYGPTSTVFYDMADLDSSLTPPGTLSAMELLLRTVPERKIDIFSAEPLNTLIRAKWASYKIMYFLSSLVHLVVMALFSIAVFYAGTPSSPTGNSTDNSNGSESESQSGTSIAGFLVGGNVRSEDIIASVSGIIVMVYISTRLLPWLYESTRKLRYLFKGRLHSGPSMAYSTPLCEFFGLEPLDPVSVTYYVSVLSWFALFIIGNPTAKIVGGIGLLSGWYLLLVYLTPLKSVGLFSVVLNRMITHDLLRFFTVFVVIFVAFTTSLMCFLGPDQPLQTSTFFDSYWTLLRVMVGLYDLDDALERAAYPLLARIVAFLFIIVTMIQLLNMLIAAMTNTFADVSAVSDHLWIKLLAESTISFESHLPRFLRPNMILKRLSGTEDGEVAEQIKWFLTVETI